MSSLSAIAAFMALPSEDLGRLEQGATRIDISDRGTIFSQGDLADSVYAVLSGDGSVRISSFDHRGKRLMVEVFRAGDIFGEISVIDGGVRTAGAYAEGRLRLLKIKASVFVELLAGRPELGISLCKILADRLRRTFMLMEDATFEPLEVRLARQLLYLADRDSRHTSQGLRVAGRFRQTDLADLLGTTPRSIITILNSWRASNIVIYDAHSAHVTLCNETALRKLIDRDGYSERNTSPAT
jgi:CRP/FNR family cyclic AMP-dependent transcriptional regulator